jgi:hypothetical protein
MYTNHCYCLLRPEDIFYYSGFDDPPDFLAIVPYPSKSTPPLEVRPYGRATGNSVASHHCREVNRVNPAMAGSITRTDKTARIPAHPSGRGNQPLPSILPARVLIKLAFMRGL